MKRVTARNLFIGLSLISILVTGCAETYKLTVEDSVARAGDKARLTGHLVMVQTGVVNQEMEKQDLAFYVDNLLAGMKETDGHGYATVAYPTKEPGVKPIKVIFTGRTFQTQSTGRLFIWKKNSRVLLVDVDGMACRKNNVALPLAGKDFSQTAPGAVSALQELSQYYHIIYLTNQPRENIPRTSTWLTQNNFPAGPVLRWDLEKIQNDFPNAGVGIGTTEEVYQMFRARRIFSILLDPTKPAEPIDKGIHVPSWNDIPTFLKSNTK